MCLLISASVLSLYILRPVLMDTVLSKGTRAFNVLADFVDTVLKEEDEEPYLTAVVCNRVFPEDMFNITAYECKQWIEYLLFAGVQHIYWYDTAHSDAESQALYLQKYVDKGLLTYQRFHHLFPGTMHKGYYFEQDRTYAHFIETYGDGVVWTVDVDVDEYPFMPSDTKRSFLRRFVENFEKSNPDVTQILMPNLFFVGEPKGDLENGWVIERYQRRKLIAETSGIGSRARQKLIFQLKHTKNGSFLFTPHEFAMAFGDTRATELKTLRINHYWGPRVSNFQPDTAEVLNLVVPDSSAQAIAAELKASTGLTNKAACLQEHSKAVNDCVNCHV